MNSTPRASTPSNGTGSANRRQDIAAYVRSEIFDGRFRPGHKIDQDDVADATGSSRIPVREALIVLEREGLVAWAPFRGTFVAQLTEADLRDHFALLGSTAAMLVDHLHTAGDQARLARVTVAVEWLFASQDEATARSRLGLLRDTLLDAGISHRLALEYESLTASLPLWRFAEGYRRPRPRRSASRQERLADAHAYYADLGEHVIERLRKDGFWAGPSGGA